MKPESISKFNWFISSTTMAKKKIKEVYEDLPVEKEVEEVVPPKHEVKEWTYDELVLLPRDEYLAVAADIKAGKAKVKPL